MPDNFVKLVVTAVAIYLLLRLGFAMIRGLARPLPEPPPPGELRRVNLRYRCSSCGTELRMTRAVHEYPEPPRHCMDTMEIVQPDLA